MDTVSPTLSAADIYAATPLPVAMPPAADFMGKTSMDFESVFLSQMMQAMFQDVSLSGWEGEEGMGGEEVYRSWMVDQYGKLIAAHGGIGLASAVKNEMIKLQEIGNERARR